MMELSMEQEEMIYERLPRDIKEAISESVKEVSNADTQDIKYIFNKTRNIISDVLVGTHRYSESEVERLTSDLLSEYESKINEKAKEERTNTGDRGTSIISSMSKKEILRAEEVETKEEKNEAFNRSYNNILGYSGDIIKDENVEAKKKYNYAVEDLVLTELKSEIKRRMNVYDSRAAEDAFNDVSSVLSRRLLGDLQNSFDENSNMIVRSVSEKVNEAITEFKKEYEKITEKEGKNKNNETTDKKLDLSDLVATPEEAQKSEEKRLNEKVERTNRQKLEDLFK